MPRLINAAPFRSSGVFVSDHQVYARRSTWGAVAVGYSIKLGKEPNVLMINDLSSRQAVSQARELKAGSIKFSIYASDGTLTELYDLERAIEGDGVPTGHKGGSQD